jgi:hypothetical protein
MFDFKRIRKNDQFEEFLILLPEKALAKGDDRFGESVWCLGYGEPFPRHFQIGTLLVMPDGLKFGQPATRIIIMAKDGLTDDEKLQLETEIQLLIGGLVDCEGGLSSPTKGWFAEDRFFVSPQFRAPE